jgi:dihydrolipoamide dehydrogenase
MNYDVIVIGGGTAGLAAYRKAKSLKKKVLIIEAHDFVTTCADVGCMPSKLLIAAAKNKEEINKSSQFGIDVRDVSINNKVLWNRIRSERDRFVSFVKKGVENIPNKDKLIGYATFVDKNTVEVNGIRLTSKSIVIATGSSPIIPSIFSDIKDEILTNENIFELEKLPKSVAVFGAGVIGLELGLAFHSLGVKVVFFNKGEKLVKLNKDINDYVVKDLKEKVQFISHEEVTKIVKLKNNYKILYGDKDLNVEKIIVATGRKPNLSNLKIERLTTEDITKLYNSKTTQIGNLPVFLAGDVSGEIPLLHEASKEGVIAGFNAAKYPRVKKHKRNVLLSVIFTNPQIMQVGDVVEIEGKDVIKGQILFDDQGRSRVELKNKGMLNIYFNKKTHRLIGAEMYGPSAEHLAHSLAWLIEKKVTLKEMLDLPYYHPVIEEGLRTAVRDANSKVAKNK